MADTRVHESKSEPTDLSMAKSTKENEPAKHSYIICPFIVKIKHLGLNMFPWLFLHQWSLVWSAMKLPEFRWSLEAHTTKQL